MPEAAHAGHRRQLELQHEAARQAPLDPRAKVVVSGEKPCPCFNAAGEPVALPTDWVDLAVLPIIAVKSVYLQKVMAGLVLEVVSLMVGERQERHQLSVDWL